jgi:hypothetical protein
MAAGMMAEKNFKLVYPTIPPRRLTTKDAAIDAIAPNTMPTTIRLISFMSLHILHNNKQWQQNLDFSGDVTRVIETN